jgi:hypothetical protein
LRLTHHNQSILVSAAGNSRVVMGCVSECMLHVSVGDGQILSVVASTSFASYTPGYGSKYMYMSRNGLWVRFVGQLSRKMTLDRPVNEPVTRKVGRKGVRPRWVAIELRFSLQGEGVRSASMAQPIGARPIGFTYRNRESIYCRQQPLNW